MLFWALCWGCGREPRPNIVILLMDTLRPDRLGCYGYSRNPSPGVDSLAARGTLFTHCYATSDYTPASTASLFTGQYPLTHGYVNADYRLAPGNLTLAEILHDQGYRTAGFTANSLVGAKYHMDQGFDEFFERNRASAEELVTAMVAFVQRWKKKPFLIYAHFMDVHDPYRIPIDRQARFADPRQFAYDMQDTLLHEQFVMRAWWGIAQQWWDDERQAEESQVYFGDYSDLYDAAIAYWDDALRDLFAALAAAGVDQRTLVIVVADHGEQLLEHGFFGHANSGYDVGLHIPLIFYDPLHPEGTLRRIEQPVSLVDLLPTLLARLELKIPPQIQGQERWSLLQGKTSENKSEGIYTEGTFFANRPFNTLIQTYREGRWKLILDRLRDVKELYDLEHDPGEQQNRFADCPQVVASLVEKLRQHYHQNLELFIRQQHSPQFPEEERMRELRALGYLASGRRPGGMSPEFHSMKPIRLEPFGPFGDEEDLARFGSALDFTHGQVNWGQVIRGYSDRGNADTSGCWFDRRATFLLRNHGRARRAVFEVNAVPDPQGCWPHKVEIEFNDQVAQTLSLEKVGRHRLAAEIPPLLKEAAYFHCGLRADHRFVLRPGDSPRTDIYGALKIYRVFLEK